MEIAEPPAPRTHVTLVCMYEGEPVVRFPVPIHVARVCEIVDSALDEDPDMDDIPILVASSAHLALILQYMALYAETPIKFLNAPLIDNDLRASGMPAAIATLLESVEPSILLNVAQDADSLRVPMMSVAIYAHCAQCIGRLNEEAILGLVKVEEGESHPDREEIMKQYEAAWTNEKDVLNERFPEAAALAEENLKIFPSDAAARVSAVSGGGGADSGGGGGGGSAVSGGGGGGGGGADFGAKAAVLGTEIAGPPFAAFSAGGDDKHPGIY